MDMCNARLEDGPRRLIVMPGQRIGTTVFETTGRSI